MSAPLSSTTYDNLSPGTTGLTPLEPPAGRPFGPIERRLRVSRSMIWRLLRRFYAEQGVDAWASKRIPSHATSNPYIAASYARIVLGFMRDAQRTGGSRLDIIEIGAGHGRFTFLFLTALLDAYDRSSLAGFPFRYIATDLAEKNLEHLRRHPRLAPFVARGVLDFARYEVGSHRGITLASGAITPEEPGDHVAVIANYVFDSLPQDVFWISGGRLHETLLSLEIDGDIESPGALSRARVSYDKSPAPASYYGDPEWDALLAGYAGRLPECSFQLPIAALGAIRELRASARRGFLLLSGDKGHTTEEELQRGLGEPGLVAHDEGCFSISVNYHAIGEYFVRTGGRALHPGRGHESLNISAFLAPADGLTEARAAYEDAIGAFNPDDLNVAMTALAGHHDAMTLAQNLAFVRLSGHDAYVFMRCAPALALAAATASEVDQQKIHRTVHQVWETYFPLGEPFDLAFQLGEMLYQIRYFAEAIPFFERSIELRGPTPGAFHDIGLCHHQLGASREALECFARALALDPDYEPSRAMRIKLEATRR